MTRAHMTCGADAAFVSSGRYLLDAGSLHNLVDLDAYRPEFSRVLKKPSHTLRKTPLTALFYPVTPDSLLKMFADSLQLRTKIEDPQGPLALRVHLQTMDNRTRKVHPKPDPSNAGTEHLVQQ